MPINFFFYRKKKNVSASPSMHTGGFNPAYRFDFSGDEIRYYSTATDSFKKYDISTQYERVR